MAKSIAELRQELVALKSELASTTDPAQMQRLAQAAGQVRDQLKDVNEQVAVFAAGTNFEVASNQLKAVGSSLKELDFEKAQQQSANLVNTVKQFSLKGAIDSVKALGSTFVNLGRALLANPLFLLASVIAAISIAVVALLSKLGLLQPILDGIQAAIGVVVEQFEKLTDWLGLTENAANKNADAQKAASEKVIAAAEDRGKAEENFYNLYKDLSEEEIALLEKKLGVEIDTAKDQFDIREETLKSIQEQTAKQIEAIEAIRKKTPEQIEDLEKLKAAYEKTNADIVANVQARAAAEVKAESDAKAAAKKAEDDAAKARATAAAKAKARRENNAKEELELLRLQGELELSILGDNQKERLIAIKVQAIDEAELLKRNAIALGLITAEGDNTRLKLALVKLQERVNKEQEAYDKLEAEKTAKLQQALVDRQNAELSIQEITANNELNNAKLALDNFRGTADQRIRLINQVRAASIVAIEAEKQARIDAIQDQIDAISKSPAGETPEALAARLAKIQEFEAQKKAIEDQARNDKTAADIAASEQVQQANREAFEQSIANTQQYVAAAGQAIADFGAIAEGIFEAQNNFREARNEQELAGLQEGTQAYASALARQEVERDKAARKQFAINKALQLANAAIQGTQAVLAAYASGVATPLIGPATGAAFAAVAGVVAAANIAKIASQQYKGSGGSTGAASTGASGGGISTPATSTVTGGGPATPNVNLFGQGNNQNTTPATAPAMTAQNITVTAVVSETDVTATQQRVERMRQSAEL